MSTGLTENWYLYLIRDREARLYTGISTDPHRRLAQHQAGKGAKALRGRQDLQLVFSAQAGSRSTAQRLEYQVKQLSKNDKQRLIAGTLALDRLLIICE